MNRRIIITHLAAVLASASAGAALLRSRAVVWPWMTTSARMIAELVAYNAFVLFIIEPLLRRWFPPLKPWEHVTGLFGGARTTYEEIVPAVATTLWILGNAFLLAMMNRRLRRTHPMVPADLTNLDPRPGR